MRPLRLAVIGGGVAGLAAAHRLLEQGRAAGVPVHVTLFEAAARLGGKVATERTAEGFVVEYGPDSFLARKPALLRLADRIGLADEIVGPHTPSPGFTVWWDGRLHTLPQGYHLMVPKSPAVLWRTSLLSFTGKLRALLDLSLPRGPAGDQTLTGLVGRRLGREVLERIAEPLVASIHSADPDSMSLAASFPALLEMEAQHRSLMRGARALLARAQAHRSAAGFVSFRSGMATLVDGLRAAMPELDLRLASRVEALRAEGGQVVLTVRGTRETFSGAVLAVPAGAAGQLLAGISPEIPRRIAAHITEPPIATVTFAYRASDVSKPPPGHGFVVPSAAGRQVLGVTVLSAKWPGRVPSDDFVLLRAFVGGPRGVAVIRQGEAAVTAAAQAEMRELVGVAAAPVLTRAHIWDPGMPRYTLGHVERTAAVERELESICPAVRLAGSAFHGIGLPDCVASGERAAEALWRWTTTRSAP
jgi:oxygen-dependent protoporphyrinogen oxidase